MGFFWDSFEILLGFFKDSFEILLGFLLNPLRFFFLEILVGFLWDSDWIRWMFLWKSEWILMGFFLSRCKRSSTSPGQINTVSTATLCLHAEAQPTG